MDNDIKLNNVNKTASFDDLGKIREMASKENYNSSIDPGKTSSPAPDIFKISSENTPSYKERVDTRDDNLKNISSQIKSSSKSTSGSDFVSANDVFRVGKQAPLNPYGKRVPITESHISNYAGVWKSKYPTYIPDINNEDMYARNQKGWDKFVNGMGKLAAKTFLYGAHGTVAIEDKVANWVSKGFDGFNETTDIEKLVDDLDKSIDLMFPHYYKAETKNYNFWQSLTKDTGNFLMNDVIGSGLSFTLGAMATAAVTGGIGGANNIAKGFARMGMRKAIRDNLNGALAGSKGIFNKNIREAARRWGNIGKGIQTGAMFTKSAAFEAGFETQSFIKESESNFKDYYNRVYGRDPNIKEMSEFRKEVGEAANYVYGANLFIVGSSNMIFFGKALRNAAKPSSVFSTGRGGIEKRIDKWLGIKAVPEKSGSTSLKLSEQSKIQKAISTAFNVSKRPLSEGLWEEGMQGVTSGTATDYVSSKYNRVKHKDSLDMIDSFWGAFKNQYTSKEGLKEVGIGAIIGSLFGVKQGFGFTENAQKRNILSSQIEEYNRSQSGLNTASVNLLKQMSNVSNIVSNDNTLNADPSNVSSIEFEDAAYSKMSIEYELGMMNDSFENFVATVEGISNDDIANEYNIPKDKVSDFKKKIIDDYRSRMEDFTASRSFAEDIVGDDSKEIYKDYVARTMFMGLRAERTLSDLADRITRLDGGANDLGGALQIMRDQDAEVRKLSSEAVKLEKKVNDLQRELEDLSTIPDINVTVTDSEGNVKDSTEKKVRAEKIKQKTKEIEDARKKYKEAVDRLSVMISQPFSVINFNHSNFGYNGNDGLIGKGLSLTAEDVMEAYKQLRAADNLLSVKDRSPKQEMMLDAVNEYRQNLAYYHRTVETLHRMRDPRFGKEEEKGLAAALSAVGAKFGVEYDREAAPVMASGVFTDKNSGKRYASDEEIDKAVEEGKISSDEAFTFKVYMHMADELRGESSSDLKEVMESVTDDEYDDAMYSYNEGYTTLPNRAANRKGRKVRGMANLANRIATKIQNGIPLSPREEDIRSKFEKFFNKLINKETSILGRLSEIQTKAGIISELESIKTQNEAIIDLFIEENSSSESEADKLRQMVEDYKEGLRLKDEKTLDDPANIDAKTKYDEARLRFDVPFGTLSTLLDTINQLYYIETTPAGVQFLNEQQDDEIMDTAQTGDVQFKERFNTLGNGYISARRSKTNDKIVVIGGTKSMQRLANEMMDTSRGDSITHSDSDMIEMSINGVKIYIGYNGDYIYIDQSDIDNINKNSNIFIRDSKKGVGVVVFKKNGSTLEPLKSDYTFGVSKEAADNEAASELKEGSEVSFEVELNDPYNKSLFDDYHNETDPAEKDKKKSELLSNLIVKIVDGSGRIVSILKSSRTNSVAVNTLRAKIGEGYVSAMEANPSATGNMIFERNGSKIFKVEEFLPGIPNFKLNSKGEVLYESIKDSEIDSIEDVGYVEFDGTNGKIYLNSKGKAIDVSKSDVNTFSYMKKMMDKHPNTIIPCVVIKAKNGLKYAYPVKLKKAKDSESDNIIAIIDNALANMPITDVDTVVKINNHIMYLGLDPSRYFIPISGMQESKLKEARDAIEAKKGMPDPRSWIKKGAKKKDILKNDVLVNIEISDPFQFPMVKVNLSEFDTNAEEETVDKEGKDKSEDKKGSKKTPETKTKDALDKDKESTDKESTDEESTDESESDEVETDDKDDGDSSEKKTKKKKSISGLSRSEIELAERAFEGLPYKNIFDFIARQLLTEKIKFYRKRHLSNGKHSENGSINWLFERLFTGLKSGNKNNIMHNSKATNLFTVENRSTWEDGGAKSDIVENGKIIVLAENEKSKEEGFAYYVDYLRSIDDPVVKEYVNSGRTDKQMIDDLHDFLSKMKFGPSRSESDVNEVLKIMNSKDNNETHAAHLYLYNYSRRLHGMDLNFGFVSEKLKNKLTSELENEINETINILAAGLGTEVEGEDDGREATYDYYVSEIERSLSNISDSLELGDAIKSYRLTIENDSNLTDEDKEKLLKIIDEYESRRNEKEGSETDGTTEDAAEVQGKQGSGTVSVGSTDKGETGGSGGTEAPVEYTEDDAIEFLFIEYFLSGGGSGSFVNDKSMMSRFKDRYGFSDKEASDKMKELTTQRREDGGGQRGLINNKYKIEYKNDGSLRVTTKDELEFNELKDKDERASKIFSDNKKNKGIKKESGETVNEVKASVFSMIQDKVYNTEIGTFSEISSNKIEIRKNVYAKIGDSVSTIVKDEESKSESPEDGDKSKEKSNKYHRILGTNWIYREKKRGSSKSYNLYNIETGEGFNLKLKDENRSIDSIAGYLSQSTRFSGSTKVDSFGYNDNHIASGSDLSDAKREEDASCRAPF